MHPKHGLETLAIIYSLPYAMLMWGFVRHGFRCQNQATDLTTADRIILFVVAFFTECFRHSGPVPLVPVSVSSLTVLVLVLWSLRTLGDSRFAGGEHLLTAAKWINGVRRRILSRVFSFTTRARELDSRLQASSV